MEGEVDSKNGSYWSTMRALSNEENKRFGPFSTGSNSSTHDEMRENNEAHSEENISNEDWTENDNPQLIKAEPITDPTGNRCISSSVQSYHDCALEETRRGQVMNNETAPNEIRENSEAHSEENISNEDWTENDNPDSELVVKADPSIWTLPVDRNVCTLEEIRRGQVINKTAPNECPVLGCGKKINEMRAEPSPGTIASGLRTHVLFVHYANRKATKKRKLGWSTKRRSQSSPKKLAHLSPSTSKQEFDMDPLNLNTPSRSSLQTSNPGSLINQKAKQLVKAQALQMSSLQSLMHATGGARLSPQPKQKNQDPNTTQKNFSQTTSSLFSILAGLTQQQQQQPSISRNVKTAQGTNTINISQCSRNPINNNRPVHSSLLSLLNEDISGNVASSLQTQLKKTKIPTSTPRQNVSSPANSSYYQTKNDSNFNNNSSILNSLCSGTGDTRLSYDNSMPLNSFVESIAIKTGSNIGPAGIAEAKKIIEKFTTSLICSSQTIADHYLAPFVGDVPQQKPEISPSDVMLAYKMMHKSHGQP